MSNNDSSLMKVDDDKFRSTVIHHRSICFPAATASGAILRRPGFGNLVQAMRTSRARGEELRGARATEVQRTLQTCSEVGHLSCHCLLQHDRIYPDVPTLSSPPQINRSGHSGTGYNLLMSPPSYSGRSGGTGYDFPWSPPQYSGSNNGDGTNEGPQQQYGRSADGSAGYGATFA